MRRKEIDYILLKMLESKKSLSDLNFTPGKPIQVESDGELIPVRMEPNFGKLTAFQTEIIALNLINNNRELTETLLKRGSCDFSYQLKDRVRFRVNVFSRSSKYSIAMRKLETKIPTIKELNLPEVFYQMAEEKNGLLFVTGATGVGKSTSLAALLNQINATKAYHVITLEDPIEFQHSQKKSIWAKSFNRRNCPLFPAILFVVPFLKKV